MPEIGRTSAVELPGSGSSAVRAAELHVGPPTCTPYRLSNHLISANKVFMMAEQRPTKLHRPVGTRWTVRSLLTLGGVLVLCPLLALSTIIFANQCDIQISWYRFQERIPLVPIPPTAQLKTARRPDGTPNY